MLNIHRDMRGWRKKATEVSVTVLSPSLYGVLLAEVNGILRSRGAL